MVKITEKNLVEAEVYIYSSKNHLFYPMGVCSESEMKTATTVFGLYDDYFTVLHDVIGDMELAHVFWTDRDMTDCGDWEMTPVDETYIVDIRKEILGR